MDAPTKYLIEPEMSLGTVVCFGLFPTTHIKCFPVNDLTGELTLQS